jgi:hypothetical protein
MKQINKIIVPKCAKAIPIRYIDTQFNNIVNLHQKEELEKKIV